MLAALDIGSYNERVTLILLEVGKYFLLLIFCVLSIRLWRRWRGAKDVAGFYCAVVATCLALATGYFSMRQSLGLMYSHYGLQAFHEGRLPQALALFETADGNWSTADTVGRKGVCLLLLGEVDPGRRLIAQARVLRKADAQFEDFYEGIFLFTKGDTERAVPLLEVAGRNDNYRWSVTKIFAVINLESNRIADAVRLMQPFLQAEITEPDQAYIMASLNLADGKTNEAKIVLGQFPTASLSPLWQGRYQKLREQLGTN